ncbi:phage tail protein [Actinopolymorpha alba]|uniref:phage tail protein n=1 Tax=Actinopolymorpha alba TaxID=533267 RepID=UPI000382D652|nr:phage tail protein [Actinopolymorpha alba]
MRRPAIDRLLPSAYQQAVVPGSVLDALLDVMEGMHAPEEEILARIEDISSAYRAPDRFVPFLAHWVGLDHLVPGFDRTPADRTSVDGTPAGRIPVGRLRDLVAHGAELAQWRGTSRGLCLLLEIATGATGFVIEEPRPFAFVVRVPAAAVPQVDLVRQLIAVEKPAATTFDVIADHQ